MSKDEGKKIGIEFTEALVGDISGNEVAFTITGQEYKYVNGPLINGDYKIESVERYPVPTIYEDDFTGAKDGVDVGVKGVVLESVISIGNEDRYNTNNTSNGLYTWLEQKIKCKTETTIYGIAFKSNSIGIHNLSFRDWNNHEIDNISVDSKSVGEWITFVFNHSIKTSANQQFNLYIIRPSARAFVGLNGYLYSGTIWDALSLNVPAGLFEQTISMGLIEGIAEYKSFGNYTTQSINALSLSTNPRVHFDIEVPAGTDVNIDYAISQEIQTTWTPVENGELLSIPQIEGYFLWLRYTLQTTDISATPTLKRVWLEEQSAPQDKILITMDWQGKFNNAEGDLTVAYDATKGNLSGQGGAIDSFETSFSPTDLVQVPNPGIVETITGAPTISINYLEVTYHKGYAAETITAAPAEITVAFLSTEEINP